MQPEKYAVKNLPGHPHDNKVGVYLEGTEILMLTSITFVMLENENFVCQIQIESVLCLGFIYFFAFPFKQH